MTIFKFLMSGFFILFSSTLLWAGGIENGFKALHVYNYFAAKESFEKCLAKEPAAANYGLFIIYSRKDNPFHDYTKAYHAMYVADLDWYKLSDKQKAKYKKLGYDRLTVDSLKTVLATNYYHDVIEKENLEMAYQRFTVLYPWANEYDQAVERRDSIGYLTASKLATSQAYYHFYQKYPDGEWSAKAKANYYRLQFEEQVDEKNIHSYVAFIQKYPENPYVEEAQDQIYDLYTIDNSIASYYSFTKKYPTNRNVETAWRKVYQMFMYDYSEKRFDEFLMKYPECPFIDEVKDDQRLAVMQLYPYRLNGKMGWMNLDGKVIYPAKYETLGFFKEGMAIASQRGKFGFVNKRNEVVIPIIYSGVYDFENGRAIVEYNKKFGLIDRTGKLIFDTVFTDIGAFSDELIYAQFENKYYYFDKFGTQVLKEGYEEAFPFENGSAVVYIGDKQTLINKEGEFLIEPIYEEVAVFTDSIFIVSNGEYYGLIHLKGDTILPLIYDEIGMLSEGRAIVALDDKFGFIDAKGKLVVDLKFETYPNFIKAAQFTNGVAKIKLKDKFGAIDLTGKLWLPNQYSQLGAVHSKLIAFTKGKQWGFITPKNVVQIQPAFDYAESFKDGLAVAELLVQQGVINEKLAWVIPNKYSEVRRFENDFWIAADGARLYLYDLKGNLLSEDHYQQIRKVDDKTIVLQSATELHYYLINDKRLIRLQ